MGGAGLAPGLGRRQSCSMSGFLLLLLVVGNAGIPVVSGELFDRALEEERHSCYETVSSWSEEQVHRLSSLQPESARDRVKLRDLLFFLHVPRTGGRTFHQCFLKHLLPSDQRCPRSYDKLRINRSQPGCRLISTHDDYSLLDNLPLDETSVVTTLREPVDRVLSAYEFSIEVAARSLRKPRRTIPQPPSRSNASSLKGAQIMNTLDIWPWKYLVPTMEADLFARRDARRRVEMNMTGLSSNDSYDTATIAMPFEEFIHHPAAHELVHNGATFQVAGLTNTSFSPKAGVIRQCVIQFPLLGKLVVEVAKKRLGMMLYVGLTERQNDSVVFFAKALGGQISLEHLMQSILSSVATSHPGVPSGSESRIAANFTSLDMFTEEEVIDEMLASYRLCVVNLRQAQKRRGSISLQGVRPIKFSREMRKLIPDHVMEKVAALNSLDAELYAYAQFLFQEQQKFLQNGNFHFMKQVKMSRGDIDDTTEGLQDSSGLTYSLRYLQALWGLTELAVFMVLITVFCLLTRRRGNRVKEF